MADYIVRVYDEDDEKIGETRFSAYGDSEAEFLAPRYVQGYYEAAYWTLQLEDPEPVSFIYWEEDDYMSLLDDYDSE